MAVTATSLLTQALYNASGQSSWTTNSISPTTGKYVIVIVSNGLGYSGTPNVPTVSGCNMTWTNIVSKIQASSLARGIYAFRGVATSPTSGALTIDFAGQNSQGVTCLVSEFTGIDKTGTNGSNAVVQTLTADVPNTATSHSMTLSALAKPDNISVGACLAWGYGTAISPGSGYTELNDTVNTVGSQTQLQVKYPLGSTTVDWTFADGCDNTSGSLAFELKTVPDTGGLILAIF